jgi:AcrR family transcriptional regulator
VSTTQQRDYGGRSADDRRAARREQLLAAGLDLLGTVGTPGLTVRGVLERADLAPRYFYENFRTIDDLAVAVFDEALRELIEVGLAAIATHTRLRDRVLAGLDAVARLVTDDPRKGRVLLVESLSSPVLAPRRADGATLLVTLVAEQIDSTRAESADTAIMARFLTGGFVESVAALLPHPDPDERTAVVNRCADFFLACIRLHA